MIKIVYCSVCGKLLTTIERNCAYCGRPLCKDHYINKLCPAHASMVNLKDANTLQAHKRGSLIAYICLCPVITISALFSVIGLLAKEPTETGRMMALISPVVCIVALIVLIAINKHATKMIDKTMTHVDASNQPVPSVLTSSILPALPWC